MKKIMILALLAAPVLSFAQEAAQPADAASEQAAAVQDKYPAGQRQGR